MVGFYQYTIFESVCHWKGIKVASKLSKKERGIYYTNFFRHNIVTLIIIRVITAKKSLVFCPCARVHDYLKIPLYTEAFVSSNRGYSDVYEGDKSIFTDTYGISLVKKLLPAEVGSLFECFVLRARNCVAFSRFLKHAEESRA